MGVFGPLSRGANNDHNFDYFVIGNTLDKGLFVPEVGIRMSVPQVVDFHPSLDICSLYTSTLRMVSCGSKQATRRLDRRDIRPRVVEIIPQ